jgi:hypothetical protein
VQRPVRDAGSTGFLGAMVADRTIYQLPEFLSDSEEQRTVIPAEAQIQSRVLQELPGARFPMKTI